MKLGVFFRTSCWGFLLFGIFASGFAQVTPLEIASFRSRNRLSKQEMKQWQKLGDRWLEDDIDYNRYILGEAEFEGDALRLVVMGYMTGDCWRGGAASLKGDKILLSLRCMGTPGPDESLEIFEITLEGVEKKEYRVFIEYLDFDDRASSGDFMNPHSKIHQRAKEVKGPSYFQ